MPDPNTEVMQDPPGWFKNLFPQDKDPRGQAVDPSLILPSKPPEPIDEVPTTA